MNGRLVDENPTARQKVAEAHETAVRSHVSAPDGAAIGAANHLLPVQRSASGPPTTMQNDVDVHDTPVPVEGSPRVALTPPLQASANGPVKEKEPTAMHEPDATHQTPTSVLGRAPVGFGGTWGDHDSFTSDSNKFRFSTDVTKSPAAAQRPPLPQETSAIELSAVPAGRGVGSAVHALPSQLSITAAETGGDGVNDVPAPKQAEAPVHAMPFSNVPSGNCVAALHDDPSQVAVKVSCGPKWPIWVPSAMQADDEAQATRFRMLPAPGGTGAAMIDQAEPFQDSTNRPASFQPTARQFATAVQSTPSNSPAVVGEGPGVG